MTIDDYLTAVKDSLTNRAARAGLSDLRAAAAPLAVAGIVAATHALRAHRVSPVVAVAATALPTLAKAPVLDRIAAQSLGYVFLGADLMRSHRSWTSTIGAFIGAGCALANFVIPLREAVVRAANSGYQPSNSGDHHEC